MKTLEEWKASIDSHPDGFIGLIRMYLGLGLFAKAIYFLSNMDLLTSMVHEAGDVWFAPVIVAHYVILAHLVGGIMLAAGLMTRWAALVQIPILFGAFFVVHLPKMLAIDARQSFEFSGLVLALLCLFTVYGGGRWSIDAAIAKEEAARKLQPAAA